MRRFPAFRVAVFSHKPYKSVTSAAIDFKQVSKRVLRTHVQLTVGSNVIKAGRPAHEGLDALGAGEGRLTPIFLDERDNELVW